MKPKYRQLLGATAIIVTLSSAAHAQVRVQWTGAVSTDWNDGGNWETGTVPSNTPAPGQHAVINTQTPNFAVISADLAATPVDIFVGVDAGSDGRVDQTAGMASTGTNNWMFVGMNGGTGTYNATGGTMRVGGHLYIGGAGGTGVYNLTGTSSLNVGTDFYVGAYRDGNGLGNNGTLTVNTTGQLNGGTFFNVGSRADSVGVFNLQAGTVTTSGWFEVGNHSGDGTLNMSGGTLTQSGTNPLMVGTNSATGLVNMSGGALVAATELFIGNANGNGTLNFTGGSITAPAFRTGTGGGTGTSNLDGGTLTTGLITGSAAGTINFNGTLIKPTANRNGFINSVTTNLAAGGLVLDTGEFTIGIDSGLVGTGGVTKSGSGTLNLTGFNEFTGPTSVTAGKLTVTDISSGGGSYSVSSGAGLGVGVEFGQGLDMSNATFAGNSSLDIDLGDFGNPTLAPINVIGTLTTGGPVTINIASDPSNFISPGRFPLISFGSTAGTGSFQLGTLPPAVQAELVVDGDSVDLVVTSATNLVWTGSQSNAWDTTTANWLDLTSNAATTFSNGDPVTFDDTAEQFDVLLNTTVQSSNVRFNNSEGFDNSGEFDYTLTGTGKITGATPLIKAGTGTVTIATTNDYTGITRIEEGVLRTATLTSGGIASPIGAASAAASNLVLAGGTLHYTGGATTIDRGLTLETGISTIRNDGDLTISGPVVATEGRLVKEGGGRLTLTHTGNNQLGIGAAPALRLDGGTLVLEGSGTQINTVADELWIATQPDVPAHLVLNNTRLVTNNWLALGRGNNAGTSSITATNSTIRTNNFSTGFAAGIANQSPVSNVTLTNTTWNNLGNTNFAESTGATGTMTLNGTSTFTTPNRILLGVDAGTNGTFVLNGTSGIVQTGGWTAIGNNGVGVLTMRDQSTYTKPNGDFNLADVQTGHGTLNLQDSAAVNVTNTFIGKGAGGATAVNTSVGIVNQTGGTFTSSTGVFLVGMRNGATGTWNQSAGTVNAAGGQFRIGAEAGSTGVWNHSGGTLNSTGAEFFVGATGNGTFNQTAGEVNVGGWFVVGRFGGGVGEVNLSGGTFNQTTENRFLQIGEDGTGVVNVSGTGVLNIASTGEGIRLGSNAAGIGTLNLNAGGTVVTNRIIQGAGTGTLNFNGGVLVARTGSNMDFISGLDEANILGGGAIIDSNGQDLDIFQVIAGGGSFTKRGEGTLTLGGANTYTGNTVVVDGTLSLLAPNLGDNSTVTIGTTAGSPAVLDLPDAGSDTVGALIIDGVAQPLGTYSAANSNGAITGAGQLVVSGTTASPFDTWIGGFFPGETNPNVIGANADPDNDGQSNSVEFALGGNPSSGTNNAKVYSLKADSSADADALPELLMTIAVRSGTPAFTGATATHDGVTYTVEGSTTLTAWDQAVTPVNTVATGLPAAPSGYEYRTFSLNGSNGLPSLGFMRVRITP